MKQLQDILILRRALENFHKIPDSEWEKIVSSIKFVTIEKGNSWIKSGEPIKNLGFVVRGIFRKYFLLESGKEFTKGFSVEGDFVTSYAALLKEMDSEINIEALENSLLIIIEYQEIVNAYERDICWQIIGRKLAELLFIQREQREYQLLTLSPKQRLEEFENEFPTLLTRIPQYQIASYLGITPVALSRIKHRK